MTRFRVFTGKGPNQYIYQNLEEKINRWLGENPNIKVTTSTYDSGASWIGVFYTTKRKSKKGV